MRIRQKSLFLVAASQLSDKVKRIAVMRMTEKVAFDYGR